MWLRIGMVVAALAIVAGAYFHGRSTGWDIRDAEYRAAALKERERQNAENEEAQRRSQVREQKLLDTIAALRKLNEVLSNEARNDPNADNRAIGADSVRRLNQLNEPAGPQ